jgi:phospholipid transport system transporter-binding protein
VNATTGEVLVLEGPLSVETLSDRVLPQSDAYCCRSDLPECLSIDFAKVTEVDSSAVALLLEWRRESQRRGKNLSFVNLPANLMALAELYGVDDLIQPHRS